MAEYIEREAVKKIFENTQIISNGEYSGYCTEDINVDDIPTEDVEPVAHGQRKTKRGNYITGGGNPLWCCSNCGYVVGASLLPPKYNHCPSCGAKMEEAR